ncbi:MAG TPA: polymerase [Sphingobacteriaceae bacterium]|nr:polymerase [Sphingobacteriaceae bacterium]
MKKYLVLLLFCMTTAVNPGMAQLKTLKKIISSESDSTRSSSFLPLPAVSYSQETGFEFGLITLYSFYTDRKDLFTHNSSISAIASFTTKKQSNFKLSTDIWAPQNRYHYLGELRYKDFPFNFYGVGNKTNKADEDKITQKLFKIGGGIEKLFSRKFYAGISSSFEQYSFTDQETGGIFTVPNPFILDRDGGRVLFVGVSQISDSRNTNTYTTNGAYLKLNFSYAPDVFGGDNFSGSLFKLDFRNFKSYNDKMVLGIQLMYQLLQGGNAPFYLLPQLGNDQMMRGYYTGRYRDKNLLAAQAEFRYRFIPKLGAVAFLGAGNVYNSRLRIADFKPTSGVGARYFFDVDRGLSIRLDYGIGEKRPGEERQKGFYIGLAEAF